MKRSGVQVCVGTEATVDLIDHEKPDEVVIATGGLPATPNLPGIYKSHVVSIEGLIGGMRSRRMRGFKAPKSNAHNKEILTLVRKWIMAQPSVKACIAAHDAADVACAPINQIDEVVADPQTGARLDHRAVSYGPRADQVFERAVQVFRL